jgi:hypothetical protein
LQAAALECCELQHPTINLYLVIYLGDLRGVPAAAADSNQSAEHLQILPSPNTYTL